MRLQLLALVCVLMLVGACNSRSAATQTPSAPTASPTPILPTHAFQQPTQPPVMETAVALTRVAASATEETTSFDPALVERGKGRYEALECGTCHGANAEGSDQGPALVGTTLTEGAFISFLRTGGTLGNDHQYSTNRLSASGGVNLYLYIMSLSAE